jgi:hypothetical protein
MAKLEVRTAERNQAMQGLAAAEAKLKVGAHMVAALKEAACAQSVSDATRNCLFNKFMSSTSAVTAI